MECLDCNNSISMILQVLYVYLQSCLLVFSSLSGTFPLLSPLSDVLSFNDARIICACTVSAAVKSPHFNECVCMCRFMFESC